MWLNKLSKRWVAGAKSSKPRPTPCGEASLMFAAKKGETRDSSHKSQKPLNMWNKWLRCQ